MDYMGIKKNTVMSLLPAVNLITPKRYKEPKQAYHGSIDTGSDVRSLIANRIVKELIPPPSNLQELN